MGGRVVGTAETERETQSEYVLYRLTFKLRSSRAATIQPRLRLNRTSTWVLCFASRMYWMFY